MKRFPKKSKAPSSRTMANSSPHRPGTSSIPPMQSTTKLGATSTVPFLLIMDLHNPMWKAIRIFAVSDAIGFVISLVTGSHLHLDLIGTGAFALAAISNLTTMTSGASRMTSSQRASSFAIGLWAVKLASFLFYRATRMRHDARLSDTLSTVSGTFGFWFITFLWNGCCSMTYLLGLLSKRSSSAFVQVGGIIFAIGLAIETMADAQKWSFKQSYLNKGQFCNVGLWSLSQHPNFFGNLVLWFGILIMNIPALIVPTTAHTKKVASVWDKLWSLRRLGLALISPIFMGALFYGQAIGIVTPAKQLAEAKYGMDPAYQKYVEDVPLIIPKLWS